MLQKIEQLGGKLIFLTARGVISHQKTVDDIMRAGFEHPEKFDIHYTNNEMTKGEYLNIFSFKMHISTMNEMIYNIQTLDQI